MPQSFILVRAVLFVLLCFFSTKIDAQIPSCTSDACGTVEANWELVNDSLIVCEGETFQVSGAGSTPLNNIESFHWYFINNATLEILFDTLLFDTSYVSFTYIHDESQACNSPTVDLLIDLIVTSPACTNGLTSCNWKLSSVQVDLIPRSIFSISGSPCINSILQFPNTSCYGETYFWEFGDGTTSTLQSPAHSYSVPGTYEVSLTVENSCGTDVSNHTIEIIEPAEANIAVISGVNDPMADTLVLCLQDGGLVELDGDSLSLNESSYTWSSLNGCPGASWVQDPPSNDPTPNIPDLAIQFTQTGICQVILTVDNACMQPSYDTLIFNVLDAPVLVLTPQPDACLSLEYSPMPLNPSVTYIVDGVIINNNDFPITLGVGPHTVEAELDNVCGGQIEIDNFEVFSEENVTILSPSNDTTVCVNSSPILLEADPSGGDWTGNNIIEIGDSTWFDPVTTGVFDLTYSKGVGLCEDEESVTINVVGVSIQASDYLKCSWSESFLLEATPTGGTWSSMDCPACIVNDSFIMDVMVSMGLNIVVLTYEVISLDGCVGVSDITVIRQDPVANFIMANTFCDDDPITANTMGTVADEVVWRIDDIDVLPPPFSGLSAGTYTVELVAIVGECRDSMNQMIEIASAPDFIGFSATPLQGCADLEVALDNVSIGQDLVYEWLLDGQPLSSDAEPGSIILGQGLSDTTYTIDLNIANGCGGGGASATITVYPQPIANFGTDKNEYCSGDTVSFGNASFGAPDSLLWIFHDGMTYNGFDPPDRIYFTDTVPAFYPVTLIAFNDCGIDTITKEILINPTDVNAFFNTDPTTACVGEAICFESFSTFGAGVLFDFGDGNTTTNPTPCHTYDEPGIYKVTLKAFGCGFDSIFTMVEIFPLPFVSILNDDIVCPGETVSFVAEVENVVDYFWDFGDGSNATLSEPGHAFAVPGTYTVSLTGFSVDSCAYKDSVLITIVAPPVAGFQAVQDSLCTGDVVNFNNLSSPDVVACYWDFGDGNSSNVCNPSHTYITPDNYTVTLIVTNGNGCTDTLSQIVNIFAAPLPMFDFVLDQECTPAVLTINNLSTNAQSYAWDFGNGDTSTDTNPMTVYNSGGDYIIQLTAMNGLCSRDTFLPLTIYQTPDPIMALSDDVACAPATIVFEAIDTSPNLNYEWDFGDGLTSFDALTTHVYTDPGTYTIQLIISSPNCMDASSQEIIINPPVGINAESTDILCFGELTGSIDISIISGTAPFQYDWSNGINTEDQDSIGAGTYQLTVTDSNGCFLEESYTLTEPFPIMAAVVDSSIVTCYGGDDGSVCIEVTGGIEAYTILWENNVNEPCIENMAADQYEVSITDSNNCMEVVAFEVFEHPPIEVLDTAVNISCFGFGDGQILLDTITGGVSDFYNTILEGPISFVGGMSFSDLLPGTYHLTVQDLEGCLFETDYIIGEPDSLWLEILEDSLYIGMGDSIEIEAAHNADMPSLVWSPANSLDCADCEDPFASPLSTTTYVLNLIDQNGCAAIDTIVVVVDPNRQFYIPNTFTPNGDGRNDVFRIRSRLASIQQVNVFRVFDRWGEMVFESSNFKPQEERREDAWDGTFRGKLLNPDTYVFYVEVAYLDGETAIEEGTVTLVR